MRAMEAFTIYELAKLKGQRNYEVYAKAQEDVE